MNIFPALVAAGLALGIALVAKGEPPEGAVASVLVPAARADVPVDDRYLLRAAGDLACEVVRGNSTGDGAFTLQADENCDQLLPGLSQVRFWQSATMRWLVSVATAPTIW